MHVGDGIVVGGGNFLKGSSLRDGRGGTMVIIGEFIVVAVFNRGHGREKLVELCMVYYCMVCYGKVWYNTMQWCNI